MFSVSNLSLCFTYSSKAKVTSQSLHLYCHQLPTKRNNSLFLPQYWDHCTHSHCWNLLLRHSHHLEEQEDSLNIFCNNIKRTTQILSFFYTLLVKNQKSSNLFFVFFSQRVTARHSQHHRQQRVSSQWRIITMAPQNEINKSSPIYRWDFFPFPGFSRRGSDSKEGNGTNFGLTVTQTVIGDWYSRVALWGGERERERERPWGIWVLL